MATTTFYELGVKTAKSADVRALFAELLPLARERERLLDEFGKQVVANRTRREGKAPKLSKAGKQWQQEAEEDARKAAARQAERIPQLSDDALLRLSLSGWETAVAFHNPTSYHDDDRAFADRIDRHNRHALRLVKKYFRRHGLPLPTPSTGGGISFNVAVQRPIAEFGPLGGDHMTIEPALAALDKLAEKAKLAPLSKFVNPDPEGLSAEKPQWFDAAAGLAAVRGLIAQLAKSPRAVKNGKAVAEELRSLEKDVAEAERANVRFQFVMLD
jgi:hypothetical protein